MRACVIDFGCSYHSSIWCAPFEALYRRKCRSPILWAEIEESSLIGPELVQQTTNKVVLIKEKLKAARDRQKSYADNRQKPLEFEVGDRVMLKVSPWKGVIRFRKKGKLAPRNIGLCIVILADISMMVIAFVKFPVPMMYLRESSFQHIRPQRFLRSGSQSNVGCKKSCQGSKYGSDLGELNGAKIERSG
ncbi:hypothetical protein Tco_0454948 [Tanacetum coccineum]